MRIAEDAAALSGILFKINQYLNLTRNAYTAL
jgi:hypothetical protein